MAKATNKKLAVMLLVRFGFNTRWIKALEALYQLANSGVLMVGKIGPRFQLTRSVWQGFPLAPFLFLFFVEAIACFLTAPQTDLRGLKLPFSNSELSAN
ncbi:hypothetical protein KP509_22G038200 [Ceratopteris richardii]|uniref:Uncharacterized protein n=1 Tax=Ceratopteris richardii TaxID=49495 RepID=A0A8T2S652_CERRI|nr:hypothetical protein KP509_22G038200 [Ceratopteris richardii]